MTYRCFPPWGDESPKRVPSNLRFTTSHRLLVERALIFGPGQQVGIQVSQLLAPVPGALPRGTSPATRVFSAPAALRHVAKPESPPTDLIQLIRLLPHFGTGVLDIQRLDVANTPACLTLGKTSGV